MTKLEFDHCESLPDRSAERIAIFEEMLGERWGTNNIKFLKPGDHRQYNGLRTDIMVKEASLAGCPTLGHDILTPEQAVRTQGRMPDGMLIQRLFRLELIIEEGCLDGWRERHYPAVEALINGLVATLDMLIRQIDADVADKPDGDGRAQFSQAIEMGLRNIRKWNAPMN